MIKKVGVLLVHGMGAVSDDFAHDMVEELRERLAGRGLNRDEVAWQSVYWNPLLSPRENRLWIDLSAQNDLNWGRLRKFFLDAFGTVSAYRADRERPEGLYRKIHSAIHQGLQELRGKLGGDKPLLVVAHSLGTTVISDYIWDRQQGRDQELYGGSAFERMETLSGIVTLGSCIPLVAAACDPVTSFQFPPEALPAQLRKKAKWINLYDSDDVLGWPLKQLGPSYSQAVSEDMEVSVGNILTSWNPAHHAAYWSDENVIKPILYLLGSLLETEAPQVSEEEKQSYMGYPD